MVIGPMRPDSGYEAGGTPYSAPTATGTVSFRRPAPYTPPRSTSGTVRRQTPTRSTSVKSRPVTPKSRAPIVTTSTGQYTRPAAPPVTGPGPVPTIESYLGGDVDFQNQLRNFAKSLQDFGADVTRRRGSLESDYGTSTKALGDQRTLDLSNLEADYGGRGLLRSGLYGQAVGDYQTEYEKRLADLARRRAEAMGMLEQEQGQYTTQQSLLEQQAREAAIRRRAEQYGV